MNICPTLLAALLLAAPLTQAAPFTVSADGQEVTDQATGLIWRRCPEGMRFAFVGATCTGSWSFFSHENALIRARTEAATSGRAWRLPNVKELFSLVDPSRTQPAIDSTTFPGVGLFNNSTSNFWSSTPRLIFPDSARLVTFHEGYAVSMSRDSLNAVRLVRNSQ